MDADRIRQAVVDSTCATCPELVEGGMERVIEAQAEVREAALDYADLLDGTTDSGFKVGRTSSNAGGCVSGQEGERMSDLTEALERAIPIFATGGLSNAMYRTDDPDEVEGYAVDTDDWCAIKDAVRKWAELEALVADGGRVVAEKVCNQVDCKCERRIILGEGAE